MAGTPSELASFPDSRLRILNAENGLLIMIESLDRVLAHYAVGRNFSFSPLLPFQWILSRVRPPQFR